MVFKKNKIALNDDTVAEQLRRARGEKNVTLETASNKLSINITYLKAMEKGDYEALPRGVYVKTFLKRYSSWLGLNSALVIEKFEKENGFLSQENKDVFSKKKIKKSELAIFPKIFKNILLIVVVIIFFSYLGYDLMKTFSLPELDIYQPVDSLVTENSYIDVVGHADVKTQITINDLQILKDSSGNFSEKVDLKKGINIITISAQNKYSRKKIIQKQVLVK
jgi:hypothetical protein